MDAVEEAVGAAIGALRRRERTCSETVEWLESKGYGSDDAQDAVAKLVEIGELDDERFAIAFAEDKRALAGWGSARIETALIDRNLPPSLIARVVAEERDSELDRAVSQLRRRASGLDDDAGRARALGYLTRRGFSYELSYEAVRRASVDEPARR